MKENRATISGRDYSSLVSIGPAIVVAIWTLYISSSDIAVLAAIAAGLVTFFLCRQLLCLGPDSPPEDHGVLSRSTQRHELAAVLLYCLVIVGIVTLPSTSSSLLSDWSSISPILWLRLTLTLLLTMFLPGYAVVRFLDWKHVIRGIMLTILSFVLSLGFTVLASILFLGIPASPNALAYLNVVGVVLLIVHLVSERKQMTSGGTTKRNERSSHLGLMLVGTVVGFVAISTLAIFILTPWPRGDIWRHVSDATYVMKYGLSSRGYYYPWFNAVLWSQVLAISTFPAVNAVMIIVSLLFPLSVLAFFKGVSSLTGSVSLASVSTVFWATFAGFDWIGTSDFHDFSSLHAVAIKYESGIFYPPGFFGFDHPLFLLGTICLLILLSLFAQRNLGGKTRSVLAALVFYVGYAVNVQVMVIFLTAFLPAMLILQRKSRIIVSRSSLLGLIGALVLVAFTDLVSGAPVRFYADQTFLILWISGLLILIALLQFPLALGTRPQISIRIVGPMKWILKVMLYYAYLLSFVVLFFAVPNLPERPFFNNIPAYQYTFRLGVVGALTILLPLIHVARRGSQGPPHNVRFLAGTLLVLLAEAEVIGWTGAFDQTRFFYPAFVLFSVLAARGLILLCQRLNPLSQRTNLSLRSISVALLIALVVISGISSTVLSVNLWTRATGPWLDSVLPSAEERAALALLRNESLPTHFTVATPSPYWSSYDNQLLGLAGVRTLYDDQIDLLFKTKNPVTAFKVQDSQGIKYLWISKSRINPDFGSSYIVSHLVSNLLPILEGSDIILYPLPAFYPPSGNDIALVVAGSYVSPREYYATELIGMSGLDYEDVSGNDYTQLDYPTMIVTSDVFERGWVDSNFTKWTPQSGSVTLDGTVATYATPDDSTPYYDYVSAPLRINGTDGRYLVLSWRMPPTDPALAGLSLFVHGSQSASHLINLGYSTVWKSTVLDLRDFRSFGTSTGTVPIEHDSIKPDETIDQVLFRTGVKNSTYQIRSIGIVNTPFIPVFDLLSWVSSGNRMVVINTYGYGSLSRLLGFQPSVRSVSVDGFSGPDRSVSIPRVDLVLSDAAANATVIANYSFMNRDVAPLAYKKQLGKGDIVYIDLGPYLDALGQLVQRTDKHGLFVAMKDILGLIGFTPGNFRRTADSPPVGYSEAPNRIAFKDVSLDGSILINSTFLEVASEQRVESATSDLVPIEGLEGGSYLRGLSIDGSRVISVHARSAYISASEDNEGYSILNFGKGATISIRSSGTIDLSLASYYPGLSILKITSKVASITYAQPVAVRVREPSLAILGEARFTNAWFDGVGQRDLLARGENVAISGQIELEVETTGLQIQSAYLEADSQARVAGLSLRGGYSSLYLYATVSWEKIATSYWNVAILGLVALASAKLSLRLRKNQTRLLHA